MDDDTVSGNTVARHFVRCGSPIYVVVARAPKLPISPAARWITRILVPKCHGWTSTKHEWVTISDGAPETIKIPVYSPGELRDPSGGGVIRTMIRRCGRGTLKIMLRITANGVTEMLDITDRTVVITGGATGIGFGLAKALGARGANVVIRRAASGAP
ncbi:MAG: hypothetical protein CM15mP103_01910 [Gammaproteobacteria bacterium]|nr:MAG: hypothetical protein CM15mP103_01910 [Gammaproteobacteria bacterium]